MPSRIASTPREAVPATPRRSMTPKRRATVLARSDGHCAYPGCTVSEGLAIDHVIALELGGKDHDDNLQALCIEHHQSKTALDMRLIVKMRKRSKMRLDVPREPSTMKSGKRKWPKRKFSTRRQISVDRVRE